MTTGLLSDPTPYTGEMVFGGIIAIGTSALGLLRLYLTSRNPESVAIPQAVPQPPSRDYIDPTITPRDLSRKVSGRTAVQTDAISKPFVGKWMRVSGIVSDVADVYGGRWLLQLNSADWTNSVGAVFEKKWHDQLSALNKGDQVTLIGCISAIRNGVSLHQCEIESIEGPPSPKRTRAPRKKVTQKPS